MREIVITAFEEVPYKLDGVVGIVSLVDNGTEIYWKDRINVPHMVREFLDVTKITKFGTAPCRRDVEEVLQFVRDLPEGKVLIHCFMGSSRSPAMALCVMVDNGMTPEQACDYLDEIRPYTDPNRRIVEIGDRILDQNYDLIEEVDKRYAKTDKLIV